MNLLLKYGTILHNSYFLILNSYFFLLTFFLGAQRHAIDPQGVNVLTAVRCNVSLVAPVASAKAERLTDDVRDSANVKCLDLTLTV